MKATERTKTANQLLKEQSIDAILTAAGKCYLEKGFPRTTVDEIAAQANVGRATVFRNFKTKETIFREFVKRECLKVTESLVNLLQQAESPEDYITTLLLFIILESPKEAVYKISHDDNQSKAYTIDLDFFSLIGDEFLAETFPPFYQQAKLKGQLRKGVSQELMINWIKHLCISFVQNPMHHVSTEKEIRRYLNNFVVPSLFRDV